MNRATERIEIDIRGQICRSSLLIALRELNEKGPRIRQGDMALRLLTDNRDCLTTIPDSARNMGYRVEVARTGPDYSIEISAGA